MSETAVWSIPLLKICLLLLKKISDLIFIKQNAKSVKVIRLALQYDFFVKLKACREVIFRLFAEVGKYITRKPLHDSRSSPALTGSLKYSSGFIRSWKIISGHFHFVENDQSDMSDITGSLSIETEGSWLSHSNCLLVSIQCVLDHTSIDQLFLTATVVKSLHITIVGHVRYNRFVKYRDRGLLAVAQ